MHPSALFRTIVAVLLVSVPQMAYGELPAAARKQMQKWIENGIQDEDDLHKLDEFLRQYAEKTHQLTDVEYYKLGGAVDAYQKAKRNETSSETRPEGSVKEWRSEKLNCSVQVPDGPDWEPIANDDPDIRLQLHRKDGQKSLNLIVMTLKKKNQTLDADFIRPFEARNAAARATPGKHIVIQGIPAYRLSSSTVHEEGMIVQTLQVILITQGRFYQVAANHRDMAPEDDVELRKYVDSFRLLAPATKSSDSSRQSRTPAQRPAQSDQKQRQNTLRSIDVISRAILRDLSDDEDDE